MALKVCRRRRTQKLQNDPRDAALEDLPLHLEPSRVQLASPKVLFRGCKSAIRYAKTRNRLSPLWAPSDLGSQKRNTYATCFLTLHSLWAPSDLGPTCLPQNSFGAQRVKVCKSAISRLQKCYKVCKSAISRLQKCYKVCTFRKSMATTMGSQRFGVQKTQYVCNFFC